MTIAAARGTNRSAGPAPAPTPAAAPITDTTDLRSIEMYIMNEALARAYVDERQREAERIRLARRVVSARRAQVRAEKAVLRARIAVLAIS
ncbi:MAG TPA: hypothetical protein VEZ46_04255 [Mycobacteriales bacterium]|nr:hypothetical protein [Mycobacteriales bacterium]